MKGKWKIFAIICSILAGLGIVLCVAGFSVGVTDEDVRGALHRGVGFVRGIEHADMQETKEMKLPNTKGIDVEVNKMLVEVIATDDKTIHMENTIAEGVGLVVNEDEDSVEIKMTGNINKVINGGKLILYIPRNIQLPEINIRVGKGKINLNGIQANELDLEMVRGKINASDFVAEELSISCGQSAVNINGIVQNDVDLECGAGEINFETKGTQTDYNYEIEVGVGEVNLDKQKFSGIAVEKHIDNYAKKEMGIACGAGKVNVRFIQ
ncbi:DUF4097 family beta strand repeat-containing protein [Faecalimonas sp.]